MPNELNLNTWVLFVCSSNFHGISWDIPLIAHLYVMTSVSSPQGQKPPPIPWWWGPAVRKWIDQSCGRPWCETLANGCKTKTHVTLLSGTSLKETIAISIYIYINYIYIYMLYVYMYSTCYVQHDCFCMFRGTYHFCLVKDPWFIVFQCSSAT